MISTHFVRFEREKKLMNFFSSIEPFLYSILHLLSRKSGIKSKTKRFFSRQEERENFYSSFIRKNFSCSLSPQRFILWHDEIKENEDFFFFESKRDVDDRRIFCHRSRSTFLRHLDVVRSMASSNWWSFHRCGSSLFVFSSIRFDVERFRSKMLRWGFPANIIDIVQISFRIRFVSIVVAFVERVTNLMEFFVAFQITKYVNDVKLTTSKC